MQSQMAAGDGGLVRIGDIARLLARRARSRSNRENASRFAIVQAYVSGRDLVGFVEDAQKAVAAKVALPPGYRLVWGGEFENQRRAAARLAIVVPIAIGLIFLVLFATLRSLRQSVLILANVPFAMIGGILALWASGRVPLGAGVGRVHCAARHRRSQWSRSRQPLQSAARARHAAGSGRV